jgi:DNA (cytosine-5)-methyltransferase 1
VPQTTSKPTVLGLFSGAGGLDLGFQQAGFNVVVSSDIERSFLATIEANSGPQGYFSEEHRVVCGDISKLTLSDFPLSRVDFVVGGPPCQSFSAAGRRAGGVHGVNDFRGSLFWHYCRIIEQLAPVGFLFENVRGMLQANGGRDWNTIHAALAALGYTISHRVLDAADYGVPQHRERIIVVGLRRGKFLFPRPTHGPKSLSKQEYVTVATAIGDLDDPNECQVPYGGKWGELLDKVPPGKNYLHFTEEMGCPNPVFGWRSRFSDFLYKLDPEQPSKTIVASQGRYGGPFHWRNRKLTVAEYKRLQSFPDDYHFPGPFLKSVKQIGNSVAPRFAEALANSILWQVFGLGRSVDLLTPDDNLELDVRKRTKANETRRQRARVGANDSHQLSSHAQASQLDLFFESTHDFETAGFQQEQFQLTYRSPRIVAEEDSLGPRRFDVTLRGDGSRFEAVIAQADVRLQASCSLDLDFSRAASHRVRHIAIKLDCDSLEYAAVAWDVVNHIIRRETSYASVQPLYGHFTEPHPKFQISVKARDENMPNLAKFIEHVSISGFTSRVRAAAELTCYFPGHTLGSCALFVRNLGWDVRVHETNRAIPIGSFRACYPFTIGLDEPRFVTWRDKGTHRNADQTAIPEA